MKNESQDPFVKLAKDAVESYVNSGSTIEVPDKLPEELAEQSGAFVCLKKHGQLRGCIGTIQATQPNVASEVVYNAINAAVEDPRFFPVEPEELDELSYSVDITGPAEPVETLSDLDPTRYGVIVQSGRKRGLLLPDLEGVDTVEEQVGIASQKAGIRPGEPIQLYRFEVIRHE